MEKEFGIFALPAILFFKMGSKEPVIYAGKSRYLVAKSKHIFVCYFQETFTTSSRS